MRRCMSHTPLERFSMLDISTAPGTVPVPNRTALEASRGEFSEDVSFGIGTDTLLVVAIELGRPPQGG